ncbi:hypothetical protein CspeluHIS016_0302260 [Cutaneotrichosporon spelunceum]|uniref:Uncharacterized protein n=1 Tax=Cutaneotrichosporon spelunceum TaxID=1672016 RepID=A0AAD3TTU6_9TREE|nr:hypothetical protein CspeluHIS016_0302260 [Cutaneotrichosporon spelunceum]
MNDSPLDSTFFPDILDRVTELAQPEALLVLRALSSSVRAKSDAFLFGHVVVARHSNTYCARKTGISISTVTDADRHVRIIDLMDLALPTSIRLPPDTELVRYLPCLRWFGPALLPPFSYPSRSCDTRFNGTVVRFANLHVVDMYRATDDCGRLVFNFLYHPLCTRGGGMCMFLGAIPCFRDLVQLTVDPRTSRAIKPCLDVHVLLTPEGGLPSGGLISEGMGMLDTLACMLVDETRSLIYFEEAGMRLVFVGAEEWEEEWLNIEYGEYGEDDDMQTRFLGRIHALVCKREDRPRGLSMDQVGRRVDRISFITREQFSAEFGTLTPLVSSSYYPEPVPNVLPLPVPDNPSPLAYDEELFFDEEQPSDEEFFSDQDHP